MGGGAVLCAICFGPACARGPERNVGPATAPASSAAVAEQVRIAWEDVPAFGADSRSGAAPLLLTATDGTALELSSVEAHAVVTGPLAFTELRLRFKNPASRVLEGTFAFTLPPSGALSRFAMWVDDRLMEGEVVERRRARSVYERFLSRRVDPALVEQGAGNAFSARVFPIAPRENKLIIASYSEELTSPDVPYRLPLQGLPRLGHLTVVAHVFEPQAGRERHRIYRLEKTGFKPDRDFTLAPERSRTAASDSASALTVQGGNFAVWRVQPRVAAMPEAVANITVLIDTSASRASTLPHDVVALRGVLAELRAGTRSDPEISVLAFDQTTELIYRGPSTGFDEEKVRRILLRGAMGATDFGAVLYALAADGNAKRRVLVVTDGILTAGSSGSGLAPLVAKLAPAGVERVDALVSGGARDTAWLERLTAGGRLRGVIANDEGSPSRSAKRLSFSVAAPLRVEVPGARFSYPRALSGLAPGDSALVYAELKPNAPATVWIDGQEYEAQRLSAPVALLERALGRVEIGDLWSHIESGALQGAELDRARARLTELSVERRVVSPLTSFLVLETEADYQSFGIRREALKDILTVGPNGLALIERSDAWWQAMGARKRSTGVAKALPGEISGTLTGGDRDSDGILDPVVTASTEIDADAELLFHSGSAQIQPALLLILDEVVTLMRVRPELKVLVLGHTDRLGDPRKNQQKLSEDRARAVRDYFITRGVAPRRLAATGCGAKKPVSDSATPEAQAKNRRVEFKIVERSFNEHACGPLVAPPTRGPLAPKAVHTGYPLALAAGVYRPPRSRKSPYQGPFAEVMALLAAGRAQDALTRAGAMRQSEPDSILALFALGQSFEALAQRRDAARAYGSIIDLYPRHAPSLRFAARLLDRLSIDPRDSAAGQRARELALEAHRRAYEERPDQPTSHEGYAFALVRAKRYDEAFAVLARAFKPAFLERLPGFGAVLESDLTLVAAAWAAARPEKRPAIVAELDSFGLELASDPSLRFFLTWETDASDVDLYLDPGPIAENDARRLFPGDTWLEVPDGFGPDVFVIESAKPGVGVRLGVHHATLGPMGYTFGNVELVRHDGRGGLTFEQRPFVLMTDKGYADLGAVMF